NLYEILLAIWYSNRRTFLWVDNLCINQDDLDEKSQQVLLMGDIYAASRTLIVWMG
ncbi:hypothetical protein DOTSEDRAFT_97752, partial [Dothistroma septosporum NZE10]